MPIFIPKLEYIVDSYLLKKTVTNGLILGSKSCSKFNIEVYRENAIQYTSQEKQH